MSNRGKTAWSNAFRTPVGLGAAVLLLVLVVMALLAPMLWSGRAEAMDVEHILQAPSSDHWMGTDSLGRDIFFRVLVATRLSVGLALAATAIGVTAGLLLGAAPALLGRRVGRLVTAMVDIAVAFPALLLALFFAVVFGVGAKGAVLAIGLAAAPSFARLTHTLVAAVENRDYVAAARLTGSGRLRTLARHILPNVGEPLAVNATISAGASLLAFSGLSFLGLGVQAPKYDWGLLLDDGLQRIYVNPAAALAPGVALVVAGLAFNLFGETVAKTIGLREGTPRASRPKPDPEPEAAALSVREAGEGLLLEVENLQVSFPHGDGRVTPVRGVSFALHEGEAVGVLGESGSGKSLTALAVAQLIEPPGAVQADRLDLRGMSLGRRTTRAQQRLLGTSLAMVFQDPTSSFNPTRHVGRQLAEVSEQHQGLGRRQALERAVDRLRAVRISLAERRVRQYPHEFSGGMLQRAMISMGLMGSPALIIADEPTTALDAGVQRQVLQLLRRIRDEDQVALLLISHDVSVVTQVCERVLVMYAGRIVEDIPTAELTCARHPYTRALLAAVPDLETDRERPLTVIPGTPLDAARAEQQKGCAFAPRCPLADTRCTEAAPPLVEVGERGRVACWKSEGHVVVPAIGDRTSGSEWHG
jgi:oligopeptide/dipeptide ABC transporter ATP-binding protein